MGVPFPKGIQFVTKSNKNMIPWAWCVNACASVLSSVAAMIIAIALGFNVVLIIAGIAYLMALLIVSDSF